MNISVQAQGVKKLFFSCSNQLNMKFILLINVKMPTIVGILTFINRIKARQIYTQSLHRIQMQSRKQSGADLDYNFKFNFNFSEKSSNEREKCDPSYTEDKNKQDQVELSDSEKSKLESSYCGASHINDVSFFKMEKTDNAFRFQFDIEGKT